MATSKRKQRKEKGSAAAGPVRSDLKRDIVNDMAAELFPLLEKGLLELHPEHAPVIRKAFTDYAAERGRPWPHGKKEP